jgi:5'-methylthioadenosine phosphorylase
MTRPRIGIIGGSGLYQIDGLTEIEWRRVESPFGEASDELCFGRLGGVDVVFLPRHGRGHKISPSEINYRANIDALKRSGVTDILSLSAVGGLQEQFAPGSFVLVDQFIDRTFARQKSFFGTGCVAHVSMARPVCRRLGDALAAAGQAAGIALHRGGTYLPAILDPGRERALSQLGLRRDRHDQHAGGEARARGRDLLRHGRDGDRLRLLASGP